MFNLDSDLDRAKICTVRGQKRARNFCEKSFCHATEWELAKMTRNPCTSRIAGAASCYELWILESEEKGVGVTPPTKWLIPVGGVVPAPLQVLNTMFWYIAATVTGPWSLRILHFEYRIRDLTATSRQLLSTRIIQDFSVSSQI